ncbi:MAG: tRNA pseudouridine(38-40) synthase TruA [Lachnospiraceae bacterium]|nr:tRNA pseudouridine(38-40) synthase TruA [Lachnospiraceae bacterium]
MNNEPAHEPVCEQVREPVRVKLTVAYDGTAYHGWQFQPQVPTVEGELKRAITELFEEEVVIIGASRTDTGVHALCNVSVFDITTPIPIPKIANALNQRLPEDIRILSSEAVAADFHPRRAKSLKTYQYHILNADFPMPTKRLYQYFTYQYLDVEKMQEAADYLLGEHDFASFCTASPKSRGAALKTTVRTIYEIKVSANKMNEGAEIIITVTGNGFLYNMVRIIAGTLIEVGAGRFSPERVAKILAAKERRQAGPTAPAKGLTLVKYEYLPENESNTNS